MPKTQSFIVKDTTIRSFTQNGFDYLCITDIARQRNSLEPNVVVGNWMRNRNTIEYLGMWEMLNNPDFNPIEFEGVRSQAGLNAFTLSPSRWIELTNAVDIISTWTYGNKTNGYLYYYDSFNRMDFTYSILDGEWADGYYTEYFNYDKQGNIHNLYPWDNADMMDWLYLTYDGNQLVKVTDDGYGPVSYSSKHYQDLENAQKEMFYDKNGALIADFDRKICTIRNNLLTLPDTIQFSNGNQIVHIYDAMGNRLRTTYYTRKVSLFR